MTPPSASRAPRHVARFPARRRRASPVPGTPCRLLWLAHVGLILGTLLFLTLTGGRPALADGPPVQADPPAGTMLTTAPEQVLLTFPGPPEPSRSTVAVFTADHQPVDGISVHLSPVNPLALSVQLPPLTPGVFTVVWSVTDAADGVVREGLSAFAVDPSQAAAGVVRQPQPRFSFAPFERTIPRGLAFIGIMVFVGATTLRLLVWSPVVRRLGGAADAGLLLMRMVDRRLLWLAAGALVLFVPSTLAQFSYDVSTAAKRSFWSLPDPGLLMSFLGTPGSGYLWAARLVATLLATVIVIPAAASALRTRWRHNPSRAGQVLGGGGVFGLTELLVRTVPGSVPADLTRALVTSVMDWGHLAGSGVWIGGLVALVVTAPIIRSCPTSPATSLSAVIRRFSAVALLCVGVQTVTGLWTAWIHVGAPGQLFTTLYGQTLLAKLVLFGALICLGAVNLLWLIPQIEAIRAAGLRSESRLMIALRHFRSVIVAEAVVGIAILLIVPFLSGSARNQDAQMRGADLTQLAQVGDLTVSLKPSALQPGLVEYDVQLPPQAHGSVSIVFDAPALGVPGTVVETTPLGGGLFRAAGLYTPMVGQWRARVVITDAAVTRQATFQLPVRLEPVATPAPPPPPIDLSTWLYGIGVTALVALALAVAAQLPTLLQRRAVRSVSSRDTSGTFRADDMAGATSAR